MRTRLKIIAISLALLMTLTPIMASAGVISVTDAIANGREINVSGKLQWHGLPLLDEQTNKILTSLLDSLEFKSRTATLSPTESYADVALLMQGQPALSFKTVTNEEGVYVVTPLLPEPVAVKKGEETEALVRNFIAWLETQGADMSQLEAFMGGLNAGTDLAVGEALPPEFTALLESFGQIDTTTLEASLGAWAEKSLVGEQVTDGVSSQIVGIETASATVYQITKDELAELVLALKPVFTDFDPFWEAFFKLAASVSTDAPATMDTAQMLDEIHTALDSFDPTAIPDDLILYYAECYDASGEVSTNYVHFMLPAVAEGYGGAEIYLEWLPGFDGCFLLFNDDDDGFTLGGRYTEEKTEPAPEQIGTHSTLNFLLTPFEDGENTMQIVFNVDTNTAEGDAFRNTDSEILIGIIADDQEMGVSIVPATRETYNEATGDMTIKTTVDVNYHFNADTLPIATLTVDVVTGEPQNPPIDLAGDILFYSPGAVDEATFIEWVNNSVMMSTLQSIMGIMALLPPELLEMMDTSTMMPAVEIMPGAPLKNP